LSLGGAHDENNADLQEYLSRVVHEQYMVDAIANAGITAAQFTKLLLDRSLGVWIYVRYVLEEIKGDLPYASKLPDLPRGLKAYYHNNLAKLCDGPHGALYMPLLATLAAAAEYIDARTLAEFADIADLQSAEHALDHALRPYCSVRRAPGEVRRQFKIRHPSLSEYVTGSLVGPPNDAEDTTDIEPGDSLRERLATACQDAHTRIADHYLAAWGGLYRGLPTLETEPKKQGELNGGYPLRRLTWHLLRAGREADLHRLLVCGRHGQNTWFAAHDSIGDVAGYLRDVSWARNSAQRLGLQLRYALAETSIASLSTTLPPALIDELVIRNMRTPSWALSVIEQMADEQRQVEGLERIASRLPLELLDRALSVAKRCRQVDNRARALQAVIPYLPEDLLESAADAVLGINSEYVTAAAMMAAAARLPRDLLLSWPSARAWHRIEYVRAAIALFCSGDSSQGARDALAEARQVGNDYESGLLIAAMLPYFPGDSFDDVFAVLGTIPFRYLDAPLIAAAKHAPAEQLSDLLDFAVGYVAINADLEFFRQIAPRLKAEQVPAALQLCKADPREEARAEAFVALAPRLNSDQARRFLAPSQNGIRNLYIEEFLDLSYGSDQLRPLVVGALLNQLPEREARTMVTELIAPRDSLSRHIRGEVTSKINLARVARHLPDDLRRASLIAVCMGMGWYEQDVRDLAPLLSMFAPFSDDEVAEVFDCAAGGWWPESRLLVAEVLAPHLPDQLLRMALDRVRAFPLEEECFAAFAELGQLQPQRMCNEAAERALALTEDIKNSRHQARCVTALAPILRREDLAAKAFEILRSVEPWWLAPAIDSLAPALSPQLLQLVPETIRTAEHFNPIQNMPRILKRLHTEGYTNVIDKLVEGHTYHDKYKELACLAPYLSISQARHAWHLMRTRVEKNREIVSRWPEKDRPKALSEAEALSSLAGRLPEDERTGAVDEVLATCTPGSDWDEVRAARILGRLGQAAPTQRLIEAIHEFLTRKRPLQRKEVLAELAPGLPESLIEDAFQYALSDDWMRARALAKLAPRLSGPLLTRAISSISEAGELPGKAAALASLARQSPSGGRHAALSAALEAALQWPHAYDDGAFTNLIPQLPEQLRSQAVNAAIGDACRNLRSATPPRLGEFPALLMVLRCPELEQIYVKLEELTIPRVRAHAQAAVIRQAAEHATSFFAAGAPLHNSWPVDIDRAGLMELIAASAWWIRRTGTGQDIDEIVKAIFDVARWWRLHEPTKTLEIMRALQRRTWHHGCADPHACGARYHKTTPCPKDCKRHKRQCPPPCPNNCDDHARWCPQRRDGGLVEVDVKSRAGRRGIALPDQLFDLITEHRNVQEREREHAGTEWHDGGWMFTQPNGNPLDPRRDLAEWKALLREAGVRDARLHDARHTAATTLLLLGVPERAVMDVMGWSNSSMVKRYAHVTARLRRDIADRLNRHLWETK